MHHKVLKVSEEDLEQINGSTCSCYYGNEFGGLPCRHLFRVYAQQNNQEI